MTDEQEDEFHTHPSVSREVRGVRDEEAARNFVTSMLRLPENSEKSAFELTVTATENGFLVDTPPVCCMWNRRKWGFVWNGVCEWRGDGCPV